MGWRAGGGASGTGRCARTAASFWVFLTLRSSDFFRGLSTFRAVALRGRTFLATRALDAGAFFVSFLLFGAMRAFATFRAVVFLGTALFALGRVGFVTARLFAAGFVEDRPEDARDVERRKPLVTALMRLQIEGLMRVKASRRCGGRIT